MEHTIKEHPIKDDYLREAADAIIAEHDPEAVAYIADRFIRDSKARIEELKEHINREQTLLGKMAAILNDLHTQAAGPF